MLFSYNVVIVATVPIYGKILASSIDTNCVLLSPIIGVIYATCSMGAVRIDKY